MKFKTLRAIRFGLQSCFGDQDKIFAGHPLDEQRAKKIRKEAKRIGLPLNWIEEMCLGYFRDWGSYSGHVDEQMERINKFFSGHLQIEDRYSHCAM
uniref:hypothetical protein n=1 Tax=Fulvivirga sp. TaxID=1931237 RepID=UPI00404B80CC